MLSTVYECTKIKDIIQYSDIDLNTLAGIEKSVEFINIVINVCIIDICPCKSQQKSVY